MAWVEFWRALCGFFSALFNHWVALLTGGTIIAVLGMWEHQTGASVPWLVYASMALGLFVIACFLAFKDQFVRANALQVDLSNAVSSNAQMRFATESLDRLRRDYEENKSELENLRLLVGKPHPFNAVQRRLLIKALSDVPVQRRFEVYVQYPGMGSSAGPARLFSSALVEAGWDSKDHCGLLTNPALRGVVVALAPEVAEGRAGLPARAAVFISALNEAGIPFTKVMSSDPAGDDYFGLIVADA